MPKAEAAKVEAEAEVAKFVSGLTLRAAAAVSDAAPAAAAHDVPPEPPPLPPSAPTAQVGQAASEGPLSVDGAEGQLKNTKSSKP